jgi:hypothetical protein
MPKVPFLGVAISAGFAPDSGFGIVAMLFVMPILPQNS